VGPATPGPSAPPEPYAPVAGPPPTSGPPPFVPAAPRTRSRVPLYAGIAAVVIVVLLVVLIGTGALPLLKKSSSSSGGALTYSQAAPIATQSTSGYQGGGWALLIAVGLDAAVSQSLPINSSSLETSECSFSLAAGAPAVISVPAYSGNRTTGAAPMWEFVFRNGAENLLVVSVIDGKVTIIGTIGGSDCTSAFGLFTAVSPTVIDSSQAAGAVSVDAAPFLALHPDANTTFALLGGISFLGLSIGPEWTVTMTTCPFGAVTASTGAQFNATVNATSGAVIKEQTNASVACTASSDSIDLAPTGAALLHDAALSTSLAVRGD
jgi:hypothetical protein